MNFLAHLYLSKNNKNILIGNFIADAVKGKKHENYPKEIQAGILLHRQIDYFTDTHPMVRKSKRRLHERYDHYDGVIIDILYDHFLAKNWLNYSEIPLEIYAKDVYSFFQDNIGIFPSEMQRLLPYMIEHNWLVSYASISGIEKVLAGMNRRTKGISKMDLATEDLIKHYEDFESDFTEFFEELMQFSEEKTINLLLK
ncbi:MAG: ACP phosphodiesterase [Lutibacter sp.]